MPISSVHVTTIANPVLYTHAQIDRVCRIAGAVSRGEFVLCEPPAQTGASR